MVQEWYNRAVSRKENMKRFDELGINEILELNEEQLGQYVRVECMNEGIPLVSSYFEIKEPEQLPNPNTPMYSFKGMWFKTIEEANSLKDFMFNNCSVYDKSYRSEQSVSDFKKQESFSYNFQIESEMFYSDDQLKSLGDKKSILDKQLKEYEAAKRQWENDKSSMDDVRKSILSKYNEFCSLDYQMSSLAQNFRIYLETAQGDFETAYKFFETANKDNIQKLECYTDDLTDTYFIDKLKTTCFDIKLVEKL